MKNLIITLALALTTLFGYAQNVGISDNNAFTPSYLLHLKPLNTYANDMFSVQLNTSTYLHITNAGKTGFGTTTPNTLVDIIGGATGVQTTLLTIRSNFLADNTATSIKLINSTATVPRTR